MVVRKKTVLTLLFSSRSLFLFHEPFVALLFRGDDPEFIKRQDQKRSDLDEQLKDYINEWRKQRAKEEDELKRLKDKQAKRKVGYCTDWARKQSACNENCQSW